MTCPNCKRLTEELEAIAKYPCWVDDGEDGPGHTCVEYHRLSPERMCCTCFARQVLAAAQAAGVGERKSQRKEAMSTEDARKNDRLQAALDMARTSIANTAREEYDRGYRDGLKAAADKILEMHANATKGVK